MEGMTDNLAGSGATTGSVTSGTASDAMIKAAMASESSADTSGAGSGAAAAPQPTSGIGDTPDSGGTRPPAATAAATVQPNQAGSPQTGAAAKGPIPFDRHEAAIKNARAEGAKEAETRLAWAKDLDPQAVQVGMGLAREILSNTQGFAERLAAEIGMKLVPLNAPAPQQSPTQPPPQNWTFPKGRLRSEDGIEAYSADQLQEIVGVISERLRTEMQEGLKPLLTDRERAQQAERVAEVKRQAADLAASTMMDMRKLPHFQMADANGQMVDNPKILENLRAIPAEVRQQIGPVAALYRAYNQFLQEGVFPTMTQSAAEQVRAENSRKAAAASASIHPSQTTGAVPSTQIRSVDELARRMEQMALQTSV